jgi:transposase
MQTPRLAELIARSDEVREATRSHPDARVRHRAHLLLDLIELGTIRAVCARHGCGNGNLGDWKHRFLAEGAEGLRDRSRPGRARRLRADDEAFLIDALEQHTPQEFGYPVAVWSLADLSDLVQQRRGITLELSTMSRTLERLGFRYRRPKHDLKHRQDQDARESCRVVLADLQKRGVRLSPSSSILMKRMSIPIQDWRRSGSESADK